MADRSGVIGRFPFGRPSTRRPPRRPVERATLFVLGVYPSALHVRWTGPNDELIGALAVDDEPEVFWDGADASDRIEAWQRAVGWREDWGRVGSAGGNGSSGRVVIDTILEPLGARPERTYFSDCLPVYFVKHGAASQGEAMRTVYNKFVADQGGTLQPADLPERPTPRRLVQRAVAEERDTLLAQIEESAAPRVVTLGQEAADVLAGISGAERAPLTPGPEYGEPRTLGLTGRSVEWLPLTHPGNRHAAWVSRHDQWASVTRSAAR